MMSIITFANFAALPLVFLLFIGVIQLLWLWSVVTIARQKTPDPFDRIVWLMIVLSLNIVGTLLYALFSPYSVIDPARYRSMRRPPQPRQPQGRAPANSGAASTEQHNHAPAPPENERYSPRSNEPGKPNSNEQP